MKRPTPPDLEFRAPDCPMCDEETEHDGDSFNCYDCGASWNSDGRGGEWNEPDEECCSSVIEWFNTPTLGPRHEAIRHEKDQCILPAGHAERHRSFDSWHEWDGDDPRIVRNAEAAS